MRYDGATLGAVGTYHIGGRPSNTFLQGDIEEVRLSRVARDEVDLTSAFCLP